VAWRARGQADFWTGGGTQSIRHGSRLIAKTNGRVARDLAVVVKWVVLIQELSPFF
jgi:hypothetical protein